MTLLGIQNPEKMGKFDPHHQVQGKQRLHRFVCKDHLIRGDVIVKQVNSIFMDTPLKESIRILFDDILGQWNYVASPQNERLEMAEITGM